MIEMNEDIRALWFVALTSTCDWMGAVHEQPDGTVKLTYRFSYYNGPDPWDNKDVKKWSEGIITALLAEVIDKMSQTAADLARMSGGECTQLIRGTATLEQFVDQFTALPFAHCKILNSN